MAYWTEHATLAGAIWHDRMLFRLYYDMRVTALGSTPGDSLTMIDGEPDTRHVNVSCAKLSSYTDGYLVEVEDSVYTVLDEGTPAELDNEIGMPVANPKRTWVDQLLELGSLTAQAQRDIGSGDNVYGKRYYVSASGSDANDGLAMDRPFRTWAAAVAAAVALDWVLIRRGDVVREEIVGADAGVFVGAYGLGARPVVDAREPVSPRSWTPTPGRTGVYQTSWRHAFAFQGGLCHHRLWEGDVRMRRMASLDACEGLAGTCWADDPTTGGPDLLYIRPTGDLDPRTSGVAYLATKRRWATQLYGYENHAVVWDLDTIGNAHDDGSLVVDGGAHWCTAFDGKKHNGFIRGLAMDLVADRMEPPDVIGGATMWVTYSDDPSSPWGAGRDNLWIRCQCLAETAALSPGGAPNWPRTVGFYAHAGHIQGTLYYEDCYAEHCWKPFGAAQVDLVTLFRCRCDDATLAVDIYPETTLVVLGGQWQTAHAADRVIHYPDDYGAPDTIIVRGLKTYKRGSSFGPLHISVLGANVEITRCTFAGLNQANHAGRGVFVVEDNVFLANSATFFWRVDAEVAGFVADRNVYHNIAGGPTFTWLSSGLLTSLSAWRSASGQDANSVTTDPELTDPANGDFTIESAAVLAMGAGAEPDETDDDVLMGYLVTYGL